jgi:hypothetical protein
LKFKAYCESEGLTNDNSTHEERVKAHSAHCNDVNGNGRLLVTRMEDKNGLVFDKVSVNTDKDGVKRMSVSYVRKVVPKEKVSKTVKLATRVSSASAEAQAKIDAILAEDEAKTITVS